MTLHQIWIAEIRVRGWLFTSGGPAMELTHPEQVEIMD